MVRKASMIPKRTLARPKKNIRDNLMSQVFRPDHIGDIQLVPSLIFLGRGAYFFSRHVVQESRIRFLFLCSGVVNSDVSSGPMSIVRSPIMAAAKLAVTTPLVAPSARGKFAL